MAERPVFVPLTQSSRLVAAVPVDFDWHPGFAPSQKKKNVAALHRAAAEQRGLEPLLEVSSKSDDEFGQRLSAFSLEWRVDGLRTSLESIFQGSKVFEFGGPFHDIYRMTSREAKRDDRLRSSGRLVGFRYEGEDFPTSPTTAFYDWLYINALYAHPEWLAPLKRYAGFTDIEFNPERSKNCQAKALALYFALDSRSLLDEAIESFGSFLLVLKQPSPTASAQ